MASIIGYIDPGEMCVGIGGDMAYTEWVCNPGSSAIPVYDTEIYPNNFQVAFYHTSFPTYGWIDGSKVSGVRNYPNYRDTIDGYTNCPVYAIRHTTNLYDSSGTKVGSIPAGYHVALLPGNTMDRGLSNVGYMSIDFYNLGSGWVRADTFIDSQAATYGLGPNAVLDYGLN